MDNRAIGVIDSGVGGLTVIKELQKLLPNENIIYFGDNKNVPYGNKTEEEIAALTKETVDFLIKKDVKLIAIACNTISTVIDKYFKDYNIPIIGIIKPTANYVVEKKLKEVGVLATKFTVDSKSYNKEIEKKDSSILVVSEGSPNLAALVDSADYTDEQVQEIVDFHMSSILLKRSLNNIILGCTHFPIALENFKRNSPEINFIDPAFEQVQYIKNYLETKNLRGENNKPKFELYTTGKKDAFLKMIKLLSLKSPDTIIELS